MSKKLISIALLLVLIAAMLVMACALAPKQTITANNNARFTATVGADIFQPSAFDASPPVNAADITSCISSFHQTVYQLLPATNAVFPTRDAEQHCIQTNVINYTYSYNELIPRNVRRPIPRSEYV